MQSNILEGEGKQNTSLVAKPKKYINRKEARSDDIELTQ